MKNGERIAYDEFGLFGENAAEYGLHYDIPPSVRRQVVEVEPGRRLSALVWGDGEPHLVLLHGGSQNAHTWDTVALALRPMPLVAIDLPGHGHSDGPSGEQLKLRTPSSTAADVAVVVRALAPNAKAVVGMSYGGLTAIGLAGVAPDLVRKLMLVDVLPGVDRERSQHIRDFVNGPATFACFNELLARTKEFNPQRSESSLRRGILHNAVQLEDGTWVWRHSRWRQSGLPLEDRVTDTAIDSQPHADIVELLDRMQVPVLLARGMRSDSILCDHDERAFRVRKPAARVLRFAEAGHSIQGDMPLELAEAIREFVR